MGKNGGLSFNVWISCDDTLKTIISLHFAEIKKDIVDIYKMQSYASNSPPALESEGAMGLLCPKCNRRVTGAHWMNHFVDCTGNQTKIIQTYEQYKPNEYMSSKADNKYCIELRTVPKRFYFHNKKGQNEGKMFWNMRK